MAKQVTFTGRRSSERVTVRDLIAALDSALLWLRGREPESEVDWEVVRVRIRSAVSITLSSETANGQLSDRFKRLDQLQHRAAPPVLPRLTDEDIEGTQELAAVVSGRFESLRISSPGEPTLKLTPVLVNRIAEIARTGRTHWYEWTTLRGTVDQITVGPAGHRFRLRHQLNQGEITCEFDPGMLALVKDALAGRVEVYGRVKYSRSDEPKSAVVKTIRSLPGHTQPFATVPPVDITAGVSSADYVERVRGGEELS